MACLVHKPRLALSLDVPGRRQDSVRTQEEAGGQCWEASDDPRPEIGQPEGKTGLGLSTEKGQPALLTLHLS